MTRRREKSPTRLRAETSPAAGPAQAWIERFSLLVLLSLIPLRTVIAETHTFEVARLLRNLNAPGGAQPATTLLIVGVIVGVAALVGCVRLLSARHRYRWTGAELGAALLVAAGIISTVHAGQKHLALIGVLDFLGMVVYLLTLRQLLVRPWQVRLTLAVVLTTGAMVITKCAWQHWVELPQTIRYYEEHKAELMGVPHRLITGATRLETGATRSDAGAAEDAQTNTVQSPARYQPSGLQYDYEKRLQAGTATGYYGHPNILGSHLILFIMAGIAVIECRIRQRRALWTVGLPILIVITGGVAMVDTQSKGAMAACAIGALLWLVGSRLGKRLPDRPRLLIIGLWIGAAGATVVFISVLHAHPQIAGRSILFRYMYWQGARDMIADRGPPGVGADNFGRHFTRYKPVACPEEVKSPHSWVVQFAAEWGVLGLVGFLVLLVGVSLKLVPSRMRGPTDSSVSHRLETGATVQGATVAGNTVAGDTVKLGAPRKPPRSDLAGAVVDGPGSVVLWMAGLGAIFLVWWLDVLGEADVGFVAITILLAAAPWVLGFVILAIERLESTLFVDDGLGPLLPALCTGLIAFLLHTGIDLAMFAGGPATTFFALMAVALACGRLGIGGGSPNRARTLPSGASHRLETGATLRRRNGRKTTGVILGLGSLAGLSAYGLCVVRPAARLAGYLEVARTSAAPPSWTAYTKSAGSLAYRHAADCDVLDGTALVEWIEELIPRLRTVEHVDTAMELVGELQRRDPYNAVSDNDLCVLYRQRFELAHDRTDLIRSIDAYRPYVADYPTSPDRRVYLSNLLEHYATRTQDAPARAEAARQLQAALDLDAQRIYVSKPNRLRPEQVRQIRERIERLKGR